MNIDDHEREFVDDREPEGLTLESEPGSRCAGDADIAGEAAADRGADRGDLVFGLERLDAEVLEACEPVQDVRARKARGCDLAFELSEEVRLEGPLPEGGRDSALVRVASIVPFFVMKSMALDSRLKEKDAWDIWFCLRHYSGGPEAIVEAFRPHLHHGLVQEGLQKLAGKFISPDHVGPTMVADFDEITDPEARELRRRDAYERVAYLLQELGISPPTQ